MTIRVVLDREITALRDKVLLTGSLVDTALTRVISALELWNIEAAKQVIEDDENINRHRFEIEELAIQTIATQQPTAKDLRIIIALMNIAVDMERIGDHAVGIAKIIVRRADDTPLKPLLNIPEMAAICHELFGNSLDALSMSDSDFARQIAHRDDDIDRLYRYLFQQLLAIMIQDPAMTARGTYLLWVGHNLERVGDCITNICERIIFAQTGDNTELN